MQTKNSPIHATRKTLLLGMVAAAHMTIVNTAVAEEIRLADYSTIGEPGATFAFEIRDSAERTVGTIRNTVAEGDSPDTIRILGESVFQPSDSKEYTATFSRGNGFNEAGEVHPTKFDAETTLEGSVVSSITVDFETPDASFSTLVPGEVRTLSAAFTEREERPDQETVTRTGTKTVVWKLEGIEEISVPAGVFSSAKIEITTELAYDDSPDNPKILRDTIWLAKEIGVLRRQFETASGDVPVAHTLSSYSLPDGEDQPSGSDPEDSNEDDSEMYEPSPDMFVSEDIGPVGSAGSSEWLDDGRTILVRSSGDDIWNTADGFHFMHTICLDDGEVIVRVAAQDDTHEWAKAGLMIRESLDAGSRHVNLAITPERGASFIWRPETGGESNATTHSEQAGPIWLRLKRSGNEITGYYSNDGSVWEEMESVFLDLPEKVYVGLSASAHDTDRLMEARFEDLTFLGDGWPDNGEADETDPEPTGPVLIAQDIGSVGGTGSSTYDAASNTVTLEGSGAGTLGRSDGLHFLHHRLEGEGFIMAQLMEVDGIGDLSKAGLMIRESLEPGSKHTFITGSADRSLSHHWRDETSGFSYETSRWGTPTPIWIGLYWENHQNRIYAYYSRNGSKWILFDEIEIDLPDEVYIGLAIASGDTSQTTRATFGSVNLSGNPMEYYDIVEAEAASETGISGFSPASEDAEPGVFFASTGGILDPVESDSFSLFLNRDGDSTEPLAVEYRLSGPGGDLIDRTSTANPLELSSDSETGALTFTVKENAFIPQGTELTVELLETDTYTLGFNDSVTFGILPRPHDTWTASHFEASEYSDPAISGDSATLAGDGVPNLLKYALGLDPRQQTGPEKLPALKIDGQNAAFEFERPVDRRDIRYIVEISSDLRNWDSGEEHVELETNNLGDTERVIARDISPAASDRQRFFRLRVERR